MTVDTRVHWTAAARKLVLPRRGQGPPVAGDRAALYRELAKAVRQARAPSGTTPTQRSLFAKAKARYAGDEPTSALDRRVEAAVLQLVADWRLPDPGPAAELAVRYWSAAAGADVAADVLGHTLTGEPRPAAVPEPETAARFPGAAAGWIELRRQLAHTSDDVYARARDHARKVRDALTVPVQLGARCTLGVAFPGETAWHEADADAVVETSWRSDYWVLLASLTDVGRVMRLLARNERSMAGSDHPLWQDHLHTLLDGLGPAAVAPLRWFTEWVLARQDGKQRAARVLCLIESAEVAAWAAAHVGAKPLGPIAEAYLRRHPGLAAAGLRKALPRAGRRRDVVAAVLADVGGPAAAPADLGGLPADLLPPAAERIVLPDYWKPARLARPCFRESGEPFPDAALTALGRILGSGSVDSPPPGLARLAEIATGESLRAFAVSLLDLWERTDPPAKDDRPVTALLAFARDGAEQRLIGVLPQWQMRRRQRWVGLAFSALGRLGSPTAFAHLVTEWRENRDEAQRDKARAALVAAAAQAALRWDELLDTVVPTYGLDAARTLPLEYGGRRVRVGFAPDLRPRVTDEAGARCTRLPAPSDGNQAALAAAQGRWEALRKDVERTARRESRRLETAMCSGATWRAPAFWSLLAHPLLGALARRLVWSAGDVRFRVAEDDSLADAHDAQFDLRGDAEITIPHPLPLPEAERMAWQRVLDDYEIVQPFEQMTRGVYLPTAKEAATSRLDRVKGAPTSRKQHYALEHRGWSVNDIELTRRVVLADGAAGFVHVGVGEGKLEGATLHRGEDEAEPRTPWGRLPPIAFSEVVRDLLAAREA